MASPDRRQRERRADPSPSAGLKRWQHRTVPPEVTFDRLFPLCETVGISRIADLTGLDRIGIPVFQAVRPMGRSLSVSQGKGMTQAAARVSAMMEAIEIWHAENLILPGWRARADAPGRPAIAAADLAALSIAPPVSGDDIPWTEATDCGTGNPVAVPRDLASLDFTHDGDPPWLLRSTDGLAGGNTPDEAFASALAELIERRCKAEFHAAPPQAQAVRRIDPALLAGDSPAIAALTGLVLDAGLDLDLFDMTNSLGVTAIKALIYDTDSAGPTRRPCSGHGAHLDPETAVIRALTEAAQARLTHISGNRDDLEPGHYRAHPLDNSLRRLTRGMDFADRRRGLDLTDQSGHTVKSDGNRMLKRILAAGAGPVLALDLTHPDLGVPVIKLLAPALRRGSAAGAAH